jgi:hypothetical protein
VLREVILNLYRLIQYHIEAINENDRYYPVSSK